MPDDPLQPFIDELAKLVKFAEEHASKPLVGDVDPALGKQLELLEDMVKVFKDVCNQEIAEKGYTPSDVLTKFQEHPEHFTPNERKLLRQCRDLGINSVILRTGLIRAKAQKGKSKEHQMGKNTKKTIQKRRNKFKEMGGDKWKRL